MTASLLLQVILITALGSFLITCSVEATYSAKIQRTRLRGNQKLQSKTLPGVATKYYERNSPDDNDKRNENESEERNILSRPDVFKEVKTGSQIQSHNVMNMDLIDEQEETATEKNYRENKRNDKNLHVLPAGNLDKTFNASLYSELHNAPFEIYESAFGLKEEEREDSFPVFIVPDWKDDTATVFSAFSRTATPLSFQNMQTLLSWKDIKDANTGADEELMTFIDLNNFQATLFIGKAWGDALLNLPFLGLMISYHQRSQKNILIPFAKLEHFFHDSSARHFLTNTTRYIEHDTLHEILDNERLKNSTTSAFFHADIMVDISKKDQREEFEELEAIHFRRLFQLLIRRTFLFSFGYADCLKEEPHSLRGCLDDTFSLVVQMEATIRDALDDQLVQELEQVTRKYREFCVSVNMYGTIECPLYSNTGYHSLPGKNLLSVSSFASR